MNAGIPPKGSLLSEYTGSVLQPIGCKPLIEQGFPVVPFNRRWSNNQTEEKGPPSAELKLLISPKRTKNTHRTQERREHPTCLQGRRSGRRKVPVCHWPPGVSTRSRRSQGDQQTEATSSGSTGGAIALSESAWNVNPGTYFPSMCKGYILCFPALLCVATYVHKAQYIVILG